MQKANNINIHSLVPQSHSLSNTWSWCTLYLPNKIAYLGSFQNKETGYFQKCILVIISCERKLLGALKCRLISFCLSPVGLGDSQGQISVRLQSWHNCFSSCQVSLVNEAQSSAVTTQTDLTVAEHLPPHQLAVQIVAFPFCNGWLKFLENPYLASSA